MCVTKFGFQKYAKKSVHTQSSEDDHLSSQCPILTSGNNAKIFQPYLLH